MSGFFFKGAKLEDLIYGTPSGTAASSTQITGSFKSTNYQFGAVSRSAYPIEFYESSKGVYQLGYSIQLADYTHDLAYYSTPNVTEYKTTVNTDTVPVYAKHASIICIGGGGSGGSAGASATGHGNNGAGGGGGGGGGGYLAYRLVPVTPGSNYTVQIGTGGGLIASSANSALPGQNQYPNVTGNPGNATTITYGQFTYTANGGAGGVGGTRSNIDQASTPPAAGGVSGYTDQYSDINIVPSPGIRTKEASTAGSAGGQYYPTDGYLGSSGGAGGNATYTTNTGFYDYVNYGQGGTGGDSAPNNTPNNFKQATAGTNGYARIYWFCL
jgi:hypothetical protein